MVSTTGWEYKAYSDITTGVNSGLFTEEYSVRPQMATLFSRPHAHAIAGTPISMAYSDDSNVFVLEFLYNGKTGLAGTTEIATNFALHFPTGVQVKVLSGSGAFVATTSTSNPNITKNSILITPDSNNLPAAGSGVVVGVYRTGGIVPTLRQPQAVAVVITAEPTPSKKSSALVMQIGWMVSGVLVVFLV
ncbi:hypothetical protein BDR26DRAFT_850521 [Obelidium mucronatum]|nr:hypothetical protein BDR26DRAFT_850521 [Obelidium mucronatum]